MHVSGVDADKVVSGEHGKIDMITDKMDGSSVGLLVE